jgi:8-oxo-dGTP pyrophosphatase MutT (NUDIX family)
MTKTSRREQPEQQAAVIAIRRSRTDIQVCLIRRKGADIWGIPKGFVDPGDTPQDAALTEAWEEAGLSGTIVGDVVGTYEYRKWGSAFTVAVYVMDVQVQEKTWEEMRFRERRWMSLDEASALLAGHPVHSLFERIRSGLADGTR